MDYTEPAHAATLNEPARTAFHHACEAIDIYTNLSPATNPTVAYDTTLTVLIATTR